MSKTRESDLLGSQPKINATPDEGYKRDLSGRQIQMMAIGSAIGTGLFYGSGGLIEKAGPLLLVSYLLAGVVAFLVMRALGELIIYRPTSGSFVDYAREFMGPMAGYVTGWSYWMGLVGACMAEVTAAGHYVAFWFPSIPVWMTAAVVLGILLVTNLVSVKVFGEMEFWFASIKVIAILAMIVIGIGVTVTGLSSLGPDASVNNLWAHGGFAPNGLGQGFLILQGVFFAYTGIELVGNTAGEAKDPRQTLRRAINLLPVRIGIFYVGALAVLLMVMPWTNYHAGTSPFVQIFVGVGIPAAAGIMNFVVLSAAMSGCNANMYTASRLARRMAMTGEGPAAIKGLSGRQIPAPALLLTTLTIGLGIIINIISPDNAFTYIVSVATVALVWAWVVILICHIKYRAAVKAGRLPGNDFRMPGAPFTNWFGLAVIATVVVLLAVDTDGRLALYVGAAWTALVIGSYFLNKRKKAAA